MSAAFYGQGTGPIFLDEVGCQGDELSLLACPNRRVSDCTHSEDAGVRCTATPRKFLSDLCTSKVPLLQY